MLTRALPAACHSATIMHEILQRWHPLRAGLHNDFNVNVWRLVARGGAHFILNTSNFALIEAI